MKISGKMTQSSRRWLDRQLRDPYVKKSIADGYRSRAAYKLSEIDDKFCLIKNSNKIIDLGAAPGGWSQILHERNESAEIIAVDIVPFHQIDGVQQIIGDFENNDLQQKVIDSFGKADLIISDMAPPTIGHRQSDHLRIIALVESAYTFAMQVLKNRGSFVAKIFQGGEEKALFETIKINFEKTYFFKPMSSRKESSEIYIVALGYKENKI
jgi:23S rRNA (uridine2552-2'-O)-methyltransferase